MTIAFISLNYYSAATLSSLPLAKEAKAHGATASTLSASQLTSNTGRRPAILLTERLSLGVVVLTKALNSGGVELSIDKGSQSVWSEGFSPRSQLIGSKG